MTGNFSLVRENTLANVITCINIAPKGLDIDIKVLFSIHFCVLFHEPCPRLIVNVSSNVHKGRAKGHAAPLTPAIFKGYVN